MDLRLANHFLSSLGLHMGPLHCCIGLRFLGSVIRYVYKLKCSAMPDEHSSRMSITTCSATTALLRDP